VFTSVYTGVGAVIWAWYSVASIPPESMKQKSPPHLSPSHFLLSLIFQTLPSLPSHPLVPLPPPHGFSLTHSFIPFYYLPSLTCLTFKWRSAGLRAIILGHCTWISSRWVFLSGRRDTLCLECAAFTNHNLCIWHNLLTFMIHIIYLRRYSCRFYFKNSSVNHIKDRLYLIHWVYFTARCTFC